MLYHEPAPPRALCHEIETMWDETTTFDEDLRFDAAPTARVGLVALATDETSERDYRNALAMAGVDLHVSRVAFANPLTAQGLSAVADRLTDAASLILPGQALGALAFSCTSASVLIGDAAVEARLRAAKPHAVPVTPPLAAAAALGALSVRRVSLLTPYSLSISQPMAAYFEAKGFHIDRLTALGIEDDVAMARLAPQSIARLAAKATAPASDALFVSCTALRSIEAIDAIEAAIGRPAVCSNQAAIWACLRALGHSATPAVPGRLGALTATPSGVTAAHEPAGLSA